MLMIASGFISAARANPSARTSRPSASVLWISTVLPLRCLSTSPILVAEPDGMLSVHIRKPVTVVGHSSSRRTDIAPRTAAAPDMSIFMKSCMPCAGFRLMPPESYMMPLPTIARWLLLFPFGLKLSLTMRGGSVLPALTPRMPPQPSFSSSDLPNTSICRPRSRATSSAISAMREAVSSFAGALARSRASIAAEAMICPTFAPAASALSRSAVVTSVSCSSGTSLFWLLRCS